MALTISITDTDLYTKVRAFILDIVPTGTLVIRGPVNRAAQPAADHVVITLVARKRLRTNVTTYSDPSPTTGTAALEEGVQREMQVDFYGDTLAPDWAAMFETVWRSEYACRALAPTCQPLYADEARQMPLVTGEEQYLERWMVRAMLQYNPVTTTVQEFADTLVVDLINVDVSYPP
jgi:hypothetical protein